MNIGSSKSFWGHECQLDGGGGRITLSLRRVGYFDTGSPDVRSPEVGISEVGTYNQLKCDTVGML